MQNNHVTVLEINQDALDFNFNFFKSKLNPATKILVVVKAFGYGLEAIEIAKQFANRVAYFAVAYADEGIALRNAGINAPIIVLHPQKQNIESIINHCLEPNIYALSLLNEMLTVAKQKQLHNYPVHIKFNTGLNRLGFIENEISELTACINSQSQLQIASVFSHIAASEDLNEKEFTQYQIKAFNTCFNKLTTELAYTPIKHLLNTSGIINYASQAQFDMVRLGIGLYGFGNTEKETKKLKNVLCLKSVISQIHTIKKGDTVGYNRAFIANQTVKTATIPIGHADGISRKLGNENGYIFINNQKAPIIGNVCMDMLMVNITDIDCNIGDEVFVYKNQQHIEQLAANCQTIPYELLTAISQRVKRVLKKS